MSLNFNLINYISFFLSMKENHFFFIFLKSFKATRMKNKSKGSIIIETEILHYKIRESTAQKSEGQPGVWEDREGAISCMYHRKLANTYLLNKWYMLKYKTNTPLFVNGDGASRLEDRASLIPCGRRLWEADKSELKRNQVNKPYLPEIGCW